MKKILNNKWSVAALVVLALGTVAHAVVKPLGGSLGFGAPPPLLPEDELIWDEDGADSEGGGAPRPGGSIDIEALLKRYGPGRDPFADLSSKAAPQPSPTQGPAGWLMTGALSPSVHGESAVWPEAVAPTDPALLAAAAAAVPAPGSSGDAEARLVRNLPEVSATLINGNRSLAVVNGELLGLGAAVGAYTLIGIESRAVALRGPGGTFMVHMPATAPVKRENADPLIETPQ